MMRPYLLWIFLGLHSVAQAAQSVSIEADPLYQALPFCARDCVWNDDNVGDIASSISFFFPCSNSCYCNPDTIEDALSFLGQCIISSPCCDMTDYINAVSLYYSYCNSHEPWSMPLPSQIGTAPPSTTSRTTSYATASWCSTAHFSPTSTSVASTTSRRTSTTTKGAPKATATTTAAASSADDDSAPNADIVGILLPCLGAGVTIAILVFCAWMTWRFKKKMGRSMKTKLTGRQQPDSTPLIDIPHKPTPRPSSAWSSRDRIEAADRMGDESDLGAGAGKDTPAPPPYSP